MLGIIDNTCQLRHTVYLLTGLGPGYMFINIVVVTNFYPFSYLNKLSAFM